MTLSGYFMSKSVFGQPGCCALTFALARLSCMSGLLCALQPKKNFKTWKPLKPKTLKPISFFQKNVFQPSYYEASLDLKLVTHAQTIDITVAFARNVQLHTGGFNNARDYILTGYIGPLSIAITLVRQSVSPIVRCIVKCNRTRTDNYDLRILYTAVMHVVGDLGLFGCGDTSSRDTHKPGRQLYGATVNQALFHRATLHRTSIRPRVQHRN